MNIFKFVILVLFLMMKCQIVFNASTEKLHNQPKIVIVGAGVAGIAAASKLFEKGFQNITIIEAEDRIGGRIHTTQFGDRLANRGARWVHGEDGNIVFELARIYDVFDENVTFARQQMFDSSGNVVNNTVARSLIDFYRKCTDQRKIEGNNESVGEFIEKMYTMEFKNDPEIMKRKVSYLHLIELLVSNYDPADSWKQLSAQGYSEYEKYPGDQSINWKTLNGYSTLLDILMKRYPDPSKELPVVKNIIFNTEVQSINYLNNSQESPVSVITTGRQVYLADHVIITVSLGVLKEKHRSLFNPPLPRNKIKAIENLGFGNAGKIFLFHEKSFSHDEIEILKSVKFIWNDADRALIENTNKAWLLGVSHLIFAVENNFNTLELSISGQYAKKMERIPEQKVFEHTIEFLHQFMDKKVNITLPTAMISTQWHNNPHFRGSYSYRSVKAHRNNVYPSMIEEPVSPLNLVILFAGEATSQHRFSTVDGAISSGWKAADRLIHFYKRFSPIHSQ